MYDTITIVGGGAMKKQDGFTLVELLVTIALMLMVLGIAIVSIIKISDAKKEEAYVLIKDQIMTAAEQYFYANEYLFEGLSEGSSGVITVGKLVEEDYLNKVTDPRTGKAINNCNEIQVTKVKGKYTSTYVENAKTSCPEQGNSIEVYEPGSPKLDVWFYKLNDNNVKPESITPIDGWYNISAIGEENSIGVYVKIDTQHNGVIKDLKRCTGTSSCTDFSNESIYNGTNSYKDTEIFGTDTPMTYVCYEVTNISKKSARKCVNAQVDTEKPVCDLNVEGTAKNEGNISKTNYTGWYTSNVNVLINNMSEDVTTWSWKSDSWNSDEYDYSKIKPNDIKSELYITSDGSNRSVSVTLNDKAGNVNTIKRENIKIDQTAPKCNLTTKEKPNKNNWFNKDVYLSASNISSDVETWSWETDSGWKSKVYAYSTTKPNNISDFYITANGKNRKAILNITDRAGNTNNCSVTANIDKTKPYFVFSIDDQSKVETYEKVNNNYYKVYYKGGAPGWDPAKPKSANGSQSGLVKYPSNQFYQVKGCARSSSGTWQQKNWSSTYLLTECRNNSTNCNKSNSDKDTTKSYFKYKYKACTNAGNCSDEFIIEHFYNGNSSNYGGCNFY